MILKTMLFICLFLFMYSVYSAEVKPVKLCINCRHFLLKPSFSNPNNGKCSLYPTMKVDRNLISGYTSYIDYEKCIISRNNENMCGEDGKRYEPGNGNNYQKIKFYQRLFKFFPKGDELEFLKCPNWM